MMLLTRVLVVAGACALLSVHTTAAAAASGASAEKTTEKPTRAIAIVINGESLHGEASPQVVGGRILVPLRAVFDAVGVPLRRVGKTLSAQLPSGLVLVTVDSTVATVNGRSVNLSGPVVDIGGTTFAPLTFISTALGAQTSYDQRGARVEIVSAYVGRNAAAEQASANGGTTAQGVISAVDPNSEPPSISIVSNGVARTIAVTSDAKIFIEDATIHSQVTGKIADIHVGDSLSALFTRDGRVVEIHDFYKSVSGTIAAVSPAAIVLGGGKVVTPTRTSTVSLNGESVTLADLRVGDYVTVRSNPETGELREIVASRNVPQTSSPLAGAATASPGASAAPAFAPAILSVTLSPSTALHRDQTLTVTLVGTSGGRATFDLGDLVTGLQMQEGPSGTYVGHFTVPDRFNVSKLPVFGRLVVGALEAPRVQAGSELTIGTTPPQISDVAPPPGQTVNNPRPSIYATFVSPSEVAINPSSIVLTVNGHDVTASATRTPSFVTYTPGVDLPDGEVTVLVRVADVAGNTATRSWSFSLRTK